ncbi:MAG: MFS transporter [Acidimicrobiaceae bacterium]|nr:MFS transporter [Acidimicrobiaceae bacterium]MYH77261.1 MFS transporter [Acidimicrobiaceae bacterium]MYK76532.1 MFS transporter [Acidimicrobiaceae bacterium]
MVQSPVRLVYLLRPTVKVGILLAVGFSVLAFVSTPFLMPEIADHYGVSLGTASMIGVFQLGGFVIATWGAGRWLQPRERVFVVSLLAAAAANLVSAALPAFALLVPLRLVSGVALGLLAWYGWVQAFGDDRRMGDVAVAGPVVGVVAAPLVSLLLEAGGPRLVFAALAAVSLVPLAFGYRSDVSELPRDRARHRAVPAARVLLVCLGMFTLGGSAVFIYAVVLGTGDPGLSVAAVAAGFSLNAVVAIPASRIRATRRIPSPWMAATAVCAIVVATTGWGWLFLTALVVWGFFFWAAIPGVFEVLASRSRYPEERVGDAQALMAAGRAGGPLLGGLLIDSAGATVLGIVGSSLMLAAAIGVFTTRTVARPLGNR